MPYLSELVQLITSSSVPHFILSHSVLQFHLYLYYPYAYTPFLSSHRVVVELVY